MRILLLTRALPFPPDAGTQQRNYNLIRRVSQQHEIWLCAFDGGGDPQAAADHMRSYCAGVETASLPHSRGLGRPALALRYLMARRPVELRHYESSAMMEKIRRLTARVDFDVVDIVDSFMALYREALPAGTRAATVLTFIDVVHDTYRQISKLEPRLARRLRTWHYSRSMKHWEPSYAARFTRCIAVSAPDRALLLRSNPSLQIDVVPNGIDTRANQILEEPSGAPALLFVGGMRYRPNIDAVMVLCRDILPRVRSDIPETQLWIVGANPPPEITRLDGNGVHVTGRVDDLRPIYAASTVSVVPLRAGGGTRLKILESMALGRPVVSTSVGCQGLDALNGEHLLVADRPEQLASSIVRLLRDPILARQIVARARSLVVTRYDWDVIAAQLMQSYSRAAATA